MNLVQMKNLSDNQKVFYSIFTFIFVLYFSIVAYQIHKIQTTEPLEDLIQVLEKREGSNTKTGHREKYVEYGTWIKLNHVNKNNKIEFLFVENPFYADSYQVGGVYIVNKGTYVNQWTTGNFVLLTIVMGFVFAGCFAIYKA